MEEDELLLGIDIDKGLDSPPHPYSGNERIEDLFSRQARFMSISAGPSARRRGDRVHMHCRW